MAATKGPNKGEKNAENMKGAEHQLKLSPKDYERELDKLTIDETMVVKKPAPAGSLRSVMISLERAR